MGKYAYLKTTKSTATIDLDDRAEQFMSDAHHAIIDLNEKTSPKERNEKELKSDILKRLAKNAINEEVRRRDKEGEIK